MLPTYRPGQMVVVNHARHFKVGDVVVAFMNGKEVIKRIAEHEDGMVYLLGDNARKSTDSRRHGWLNDRHIIGKVVFPKKSYQGDL